MENSNAIADLIRKHFSGRFGFATLQTPISMDIYDQWIDSGHHGSMDYLDRHREIKRNPQMRFPMAKSAIVFAVPYAPTHPFAQESALSSLKVARYARGKDYHLQIPSLLEPLIKDLKNSFSQFEFSLHTDSSPILERDLAARAGLGWFGKNSCLIDRGSDGSFFLIAEILTSLDLAPTSNKVFDHCGTCTRCLDACPTAAILPNRTLNATQCISYWTIESANAPPKELQKKFQGWLFGCDICQEVCPWNRKLLVESLSPEINDRQLLINQLKWILQSSNKELQRSFAQTPLARAAGNKLKRNSLIVIGNLQITELLEIVHIYTEHAHPMLREVALNTLEQFDL